MPQSPLLNALAIWKLVARLFLGASPSWYKRLMVAFLLANAALWR